MLTVRLGRGRERGTGEVVLSTHRGSRWGERCQVGGNGPGEEDAWQRGAGKWTGLSALKSWGQGETSCPLPVISHCNDR